MRKIILISGLLFVLFQSFAFAVENNLNYVVKDGYNDFTCKFATDTLDLKVLDELETKILGQCFPFDKTESRLSRIEAKIFGAIQGGNPHKRIELIKKYSGKCLISSVASIGASPSSFGRGRYYTGFNRGFYHRNPWQRYNNGVLTGYEPPITAYQRPYYPYYNNTINPITGFGTRVKRFFNPNYYSGYAYNNVNPIINGNHSNINHPNYVEFFRNNTNNNGGYVYNGYGSDINSSTNSGATVTILD